MNILEVNHLSKREKNTFLYKDINFTVKKGDCYCIIGPDDSGKTSLINGILKINKPSKGEVLFWEQKKLTTSIRKKIGYIPDDLLCFPHMTAAQLLDMTLKLNKLTEEAYDYAANLIEYFEIPAGQNLYQMTESENKCTYIVSALLSKPELLIIDEPYNFLTEAAKQKFENLLIKYKQEGNTLFIANESYDELASICNHLSLIKNGIQSHSNINPKAFSSKKLIIIKRNAITEKLAADNPNNNTAEAIRNNLPNSISEKLTTAQLTNSEIKYTFDGDNSDLSKLLINIEAFDYSITNITLEEQLLNISEEADKKC